ncbi:RNA polymerase sigma-I factor [Thermoanaerobacterium sp. DL9XJH110]|uniref:RNA polymerase sigma-I factor n=1 Tax=Thermoanaerobacterium sp. DL9XJH110 TaxID=3386643 RepID=UPI003BB5D5D0
MINISPFRKRNQDTDSVKDVITKIKSGDRALKEKFLEEYAPFILKTVSSVLKNYVEIENSEEYSIGLLAFNEAIDSYDDQKNSNFFSFAEQVIRRRLIDYIRSNYKHNMVYPFTYFENEESVFEERYLKVDFTSQSDNVELREEIMLFNRKLEEFNITVEDLVACAPKHKDSRRLAIKIARMIAENKEMFGKLNKEKNIPMADLMKIINVNRKTIERNRKFIIAVCLILNSDLDVLKGYVKNAEKGGDTFEL